MHVDAACQEVTESILPQVIQLIIWHFQWPCKVPGAEIEVCLWQIWIQAAKVGAFPPELGCSAACKTAGLGFVHHLCITIYSQASSWFGPVFFSVHCLVPLSWPSAWPGQTHYRKHNIPDVSIQEIRVDDEVRGGNVQANWSRVFGKIDGFQNGLSHTDNDILFLLSSVSSPVDEYCQARVNKSPHHRRPPQTVRGTNNSLELASL